MTINVVILAYTLDMSIFEMNREAIHSLLKAEPELDFKIILVESNREWESLGQSYPPEVEVLVPDAPFNFNAFNNLGMERGQADWILFSNNDVVFHTGCISAMLKAHQENPDFVSFCPTDPQSPHTPPGTFPENTAAVPGYLVRVHFTGWCFLVKREIFGVTGPFDPTFDYYFADDDFCMQLRRHDLLNAVVPQAIVTHLANVTSKKASLDISDKFREDQGKFRQKWGAQRTIAYKNRLVKYLLRPLGMQGIIRKIYQPK